MDIQGLWQFIVVVLFAIVTVFIGFLAVDLKVCHDFQGNKLLEPIWSQNEIISLSNI